MAISICVGVVGTTYSRLLLGFFYSNETGAGEKEAHGLAEYRWPRGSLWVCLSGSFPNKDTFVLLWTSMYSSIKWGKHL